jgi:LacI family transcriptional regulator
LRPKRFGYTIISSETFWIGQVILFFQVIGRELMPNATLKSISRATGYSITTVSRALGGYDDVNDETRQRILQEAHQQGYEPHSQARALQKQRTHTIGLVMSSDGPHFPDPFFNEFISGIGTITSLTDYDLLLATSPTPADELETYRRVVAGRRVDGLIVLRTRYEDARISYLSKAEMPFVMFGRTASDVGHTYVDVDGIAGQAALTEHFIALGHRHIAYISPTTDLMFARYRQEGFRQAMAAHSLPIDERMIVEADLTEAGGRTAALHLLQTAHPTAIMTGNDLVALGVMGAIHSCGLAVGTDVAVGGFDDIPSAEHVRPSLTTVRQPIYEIGRQVTQMLFALIDGHELASSAVLLSPSLIIRESSGSRRGEVG